MIETGSNGQSHWNCGDGHKKECRWFEDPLPNFKVVNPSPSTLNMIFSGYFPILQRQFPAPEREQFDPKVGTFVGWFASNWNLPWQRNTEVPTKPTKPLSHYILTLLPILLQISQVRVPKPSELPYDKMLFPRTWEKQQVNISERHFPQQLGWIKSLIPQKNRLPIWEILRT